MTVPISSWPSADRTATSTRPTLAQPVSDYEPAPLDSRPHTVPLRRLHVVADPAPPGGDDLTPGQDALVFADAALRRVLEVTDRRRPAGQLRTLVTPSLLDAIAAQVRAVAPGGSAVLRRVRLRTARHSAGQVTAVELFATYSRGPRLRAAAGRIEKRCGRWQLIALQLG